jgi:hypothetical protein
MTSLFDFQYTFRFTKIQMVDIEFTKMNGPSVQANDKITVIEIQDQTEICPPKLIDTTSNANESTVTLIEDDISNIHISKKVMDLTPRNYPSYAACLKHNLVQ